MASTLPLCLLCGEPFPGARSNRRYCSTRCRVAAHRSRQSAPIAKPVEFHEDLPEPAQPLGCEAPIGDPDGQVAAAVLEAETLAAVFLRLGRQARPQFAWRCEKVGRSLQQAMTDNFGIL
jgi:hypothetical protein